MFECQCESGPFPVCKYRESACSTKPKQTHLARPIPEHLTRISRVGAFDVRPIGDSESDRIGGTWEMFSQIGPSRRNLRPLSRKTLSMAPHSPSFVPRRITSRRVRSHRVPLRPRLPYMEGPAEKVTGHGVSRSCHVPETMTDRTPVTRLKHWRAPSRPRIFFTDNCRPPLFPLARFNANLGVGVTLRENITYFEFVKS